MNHAENVTLRRAKPAEFETVYKLLTENEAWLRFNGPYFPYKQPTRDGLKEGFFARLCEGDDALLIEFAGQPVGCVTFYWENEATRWLEVGIVIYDEHFWSKGIGRKALHQWVTILFDRFEIERVGLTTWSGNPGMMKCAENVGMQLEGRIRKVRYYQGVYYDSVKYGVLRDEWADLDL